MDTHTLGGKLGVDIEVDLCFACHVIWLDKRESIQLSAGGTLDLFRALHEHRDDPRHALGGRNGCPRCDRRLALMRDIGKGGRFSYYRCPSAHGRLTPFSEFLKEKQFVRALNPAEQSKVRAEIKQVQCSSCGAPVDVEGGFECGHCGSPLSVLDADAVAKTLKKLERAEAAERAVDPADAERRARAIAAMEAYRTDPGGPLLDRHRRGAVGGGVLGVDLLSVSLSALFGDS